MKPENEKDLLPFYKYRSGLGYIFYDSNWLRDIERFGYTHPDLDGLSSRKAISGAECTRGTYGASAVLPAANLVLRPQT